MKEVLKDRIIIKKESNLEEYLFSIPLINFIESNIEVIDISDIYGNTKYIYSKASELDIEKYKEIELSLIEEAIDKSKKGTKIHIKNITLASGVHLLESYYRDIGLFKEEINGFDIDFSSINITCSVDFHHLLYSSKDFKQIRNSLLNKPLRSPQNTKLLTKSCNTGGIFGIDFDFNLYGNLDLSNFIKLEKINIFKTGELLNFYYYDFLNDYIDTKKRIVVTL